MQKKLVAVTDIKHDGERYEAGSELDPAKFDKSELRALLDNGAIEVVDGAGDEVKAEDLTPEELGQKGAQMVDVPAPAKESTAAQANAAKSDEKAAPTKK